MTDLPKLTESHVRHWTGAGYFERGERYFRRGNILDPQRQGHTLKARCLGSRPTPYHIEVDLGPEGILSGHCSCPVGGGGRCKHAVALLLTWVHQPDTFLVVEALEAALEKRSKAELIALVGRMVARYPDLESLLELPVVGESGAVRPLDADVIRRQVNNLFHTLGYDEWGAAFAIRERLLELMDLGDDYAERGAWRPAITVYATVMRQVLDNYDTVRDEEGDLNAVVDACVERLGAGLGASEDPTQREVLLRAMFDVYRWDVDYGGIDMGYQAPDIILEQATPEEKAQVAEWVRDAMPPADDSAADYGRRRYDGFLLQLEADRIDDATFLRRCREMGRWPDLVDRLLALDRVAEAADVARERDAYTLLQLTDLFVAHGQADLAEDLVRQRVQGDADAPHYLLAWLKARVQERGDQAEALALAETLFWGSLTLSGYQELQDLAGPLGRWDALRAAILARLTDEGHYRLLTEIHLAEGAVDRALESLKRVDWRLDSYLHIQVAQAAEESRPQAAIRLYVDAAEDLIDARGRDNYHLAAEHLVRVRALYRRLGEAETWERFIADLREQNRRLPALQDELNKAGL
jgi:hypothetical protein